MEIPYLDLGKLAGPTDKSENFVLLHAVPQAGVVIGENLHGLDVNVKPAGDVSVLRRVEEAVLLVVPHQSGLLQFTPPPCALCPQTTFSCIPPGPPKYKKYHNEEIVLSNEWNSNN